MNNFTSILTTLINQQSLSTQQMTETMQALMTGQLTEAQIGAFLTALAIKGESVTELTAATSVMRQLANGITTNNPHLVDIVGTGGDQKNTFNVSTATAFVVAAAGGTVAKHGNRSVSSKSGSADVLEKAGIPLTLTSEQVAKCIEQFNIGFLFAPSHHQAMKHAIGPRRELGIRTLFNLLGPLTNPAQATHHLIGVFDQKWLRPFAEVLKALGSNHAMIVHSHDGLDEISIADKTSVVELKQGKITEYTIAPQTYHLAHPNLDPLMVTNSNESLRLINSVFDNQPGPALDIVTLNAGAAIYCADLATSLEQGIDLAKTAIAKGQARKVFDAFITYCRKVSN